MTHPELTFASFFEGAQPKLSQVEVLVMALLSRALCTSMLSDTKTTGVSSLSTMLC